MIVPALKHPMAAFEIGIGKSRRLGAYAACEAARRALTPSIDSATTRRDMRTVIKLQSYVTTQGRNWAQADPSWMNFVKGPLLYFLVRFSRARIIVETGVASGISSAYILQALDDNGGGQLFSIDLPNADPLAEVPESRGTGWMVPATLRKTWDLRLGDSRQLLPAVLDERSPIDIFLHDSLHTYEHMTWEFETAWPRLRADGLLISDDVSMNAAFDDFCAGHKVRPILVQGLGIIKNPATPGC